MPKQKEMMRLIPRIYQRSFEDTSMFFFVKSQLSMVGGMTLDMAINNYLRFMNISEDEWNRDTMKQTYSRMQQEFYDNCRSENTKKDTGNNKP